MATGVTALLLALRNRAKEGGTEHRSRFLEDDRYSQNAASARDSIPQRPTPQIGAEDLAKLRRELAEIKQDIESIRHQSLQRDLILRQEPLAPSDLTIMTSPHEPSLGGLSDSSPSGPHEDIPIERHTPYVDHTPLVPFKTMAGSLSEESGIKITTASRPMVEIRWIEGHHTAEVWVNREFKFAELNASLLETAFDVDGGGAGTYETMQPAEIVWSANATTGKIQRRGRVRAVGA